jgi:hypothetical protein
LGRGSGVCPAPPPPPPPSPFPCHFLSSALVPSTRNTPHARPRPAHHLHRSWFPLPPSLLPSLPPFLPPSIPPSLPPFLPPSLSLSLTSSHSPSLIKKSLNESCFFSPPSLHPSPPLSPFLPHSIRRRDRKQQPLLSGNPDLLNPKSSTLNPQPSTLNPQPYTGCADLLERQVEMESKGLADVLLDTPLFGCHTTGAEGYMFVCVCASALCRTPAHTSSLTVSIRHVFRV